MFRISGLGSLIILVSVGAAYTLLEPYVPTTVNAGRTAQIVGLGLLASLLLELQGGAKNLLRADIMAIAGVYFLTLYEFLFDQQALNFKISPGQAYGGLQLILTGLFFLTLGRHLYRNRFTKYYLSNGNTMTEYPNVKLLIRIYYLCFGLGYLYVLINVSFNPIAMIDAAMGARFSQPWARGKFGGWFVFLSELQLLTYAVPPLAGIILNNRKAVPGIHVIVISALLLITLFMGFASGTRNIFISYLVGFMGGYILSRRGLTLGKIIIPATLALTVAYFAASYMFQFRTIGLRNFIQGHRESRIDPDRVYVDHNLYTIGLLRESFPDQHEFLGSEVFVWAIVKPVPRALWPGKPEGLSVGMEEVAGIEGYTLASTFIGESYMAGGIPIVIIVSLFFGYLAAWWNTKAIGNLNNEMLVIYALGLFVVGITMRSLFMFTTAILPIIGVSILINRLDKRKKRRMHAHPAHYPHA